MGIIKNQTIKGATWSYIGAFLGFVNTGLLFPKILSPSEIGLLSVLVAISSIFAQFSSLGFNNVTARLFPYFKSKKTDKYSYFTLLILATSIGFLISLIIGLLSKNWIIDTGGSDSDMIGKFAALIIPLTLFIIMFNALDIYNKMLYDITTGIFLKEFLLRILNFATIILFFIDVIDFELFVILYVFSFFIPFAGLLVLLIYKKEIAFRWDNSLFTNKMLKEIGLVALLGIVAGFSGLLIEHIDKYFVSKYLGLSEAGIYTIAFYIGTLILLPSRALNKISSTLIAESWKENNIDTIKSIYSKSSINQFVFGLFLFLVIITNLHNIFEFLPPQYANGMWVIIIIGITNVTIMISGVSYSIISTSNYYWYMSVLMFVQIILILLSNILLIPVYGMVGAAIASFASVSTIRLLSIFIVGVKSKIWPFQKKHLTIFLLSIVIYFITTIIPEILNIYIDTIIRTVVIGLLFLWILITFKISEEISNFYNKIIRKLYR